MHPNYSPEQVKESQAVFDSVLVRAATEREFRATLLADPQAALADHIGITATDVPSSVRFIENAPGKQTIVLPDFVDSSAELSSEELEAVAGGGTPYIATAISYSILLTCELLTRKK